MIRDLARVAARVLPAQAKARLAQWRFGHGDDARRFRVERDGTGGVTRVNVDGRLRFLAEAEGAKAVDYHFVSDGDSRTEMHAFLEVSSASPADALLLDVGSHVGLFSIVHLALASGHRAVLFEPSPSLAASAQAWLALNGMTGRAQARCAGVGATVETRAIVTDSLGFAQAAPDPSTGTQVPFVTIDDVCAREGLSPAIIKIDVEGHEGAVLAGARETLRRHRPVVCLELHLDMLEQRGVAVGTITDMLEAAGYAFRDLNGHRISGRGIRRSLKAILRIVAYPGRL